ncbi:biliverdin-producing heme oxygenase [Gluconobacter cerinus]|uniref:biliverdin-producing heme oxygenase n=1 Tax=Gluconobacter TaxID=441 RepID=UPI001B8AE09E|nr:MULTISPECIES: biliverdin-producing heme oxygenase [Gluconobacter]MBS0993556.1 biliverdin-producing heme oxygenase [Gluconobacter cerinus]MBS1018048.1 biliverdin-producing heme oxygenase [Gluconobacter cerinus]MBS1021206.1 biliverdin-producing heme oxygenase [Gluconobacter cerinus]
MSAFFTDNTLSLALREKTKSIHDRTDHKIMSMGIFSSLDGYRIFLLSQYIFLRDMTNIYENEMLRNLLPDLETRNRFPWVEADMRDLGLAAPMAHRGNVIPFNPSVAVGWLYVAEGSKLGANILSKMAMSLGLTESFGARHLAPAPEGRGLSWKTFKAAIDSADLDRAICVSAAEEAFARFSSCLDQMAALNSEEIFSASQNERVSL